jgi:hypothetical protein
LTDADAIPLTTQCAAANVVCFSFDLTCRELDIPTGTKIQHRIALDRIIRNTFRGAYLDRDATHPPMKAKAAGRTPPLAEDLGVRAA